MREQLARRRNLVVMTTALAIGVTAGLVVGGAVHLFGDSSNAAQAATAASSGGPEVLPPSPAPDSPLAGGVVVADDVAAVAPTEPVLGKVRTADGAAAAFTMYASWLVGSPAAAQDPTNAVKAVGGTLLNSTDARLLAGMQRSPGDGFAASRGAYRIMGYAGTPESPVEVMIEVTAPLTVAGSTRWSTVGGVVTWTKAGWQLTSIRPVEVPQPASDVVDVRRLQAADRAKTLKGVGWRAFAQPKSR